jgi:hypothetical protein
MKGALSRETVTLALTRFAACEALGPLQGGAETPSPRIES